MSDVSQPQRTDERAQNDTVHIGIDWRSSVAGEPLLGKLLRYDLRDMSFQTLNIERDPNCKLCAPLFEKPGQ